MKPTQYPLLVLPLIDTTVRDRTLTTMHGDDGVRRCMLHTFFYSCARPSLLIRFTPGGQPDFFTIVRAAGAKVQIERIPLWHTVLEYQSSISHSLPTLALS